MHSPGEQPDKHAQGPPFFVDRNMGKHIAQAIIDAGYDAIHHDDKFGPTTPDTEWLKEVGKNGWLVISRDEKIGKNPSELIALIDAQVHAFFFILQQQSSQVVIDAVIRCLPHMLEIAKRKSPPTLAIINKHGKLERLEGWDRLRDRVQEQQEKRNRGQ
ncbi:PIN-like domain-containing protein [Rhodopirellula bahusiensis]|uniref:VapC45 PIN like domain-containing protein n=1 Tax=Rhodopirellula bahusiensis TaxID=2014065 RepID=A0A2G1W833_9BACT|nr:hypothetical protein [Rhodopirellula bahusiensis]PHQ35186.1 hypothetical protein CEE69_12305 [Rhodopirellula bahusiensis]